MQGKNSSVRLIINTCAQYTRTIINIALSLYSTRLILNILGIADYGILVLIAGVVSMLAFVTNAMISTTQRFLSYHQSKGGLLLQQQIFSNSVFLHIFFSIGILIVLEIVGLFIFEGFLNIVPDRIYAAKMVYQCTIFMVILSFLTAPYKALLISHENLVYTSIIEICDGVLKVFVAIALTFWGHDKLITYGILMCGINVMDFIAYTYYTHKKYEECIIPKLKLLDKCYFKSISSFIGWQLYSTGCVVGRTQGTAIILNRFFSTVVNAAFGIALQISGSINFISSALIMAINPQIIKAEGEGDRLRMFKLAEVASKFSFLLLSILVVPTCFVIHDSLKLWLGDVPENSELFCRVILITALIDQITAGLITANLAIGNVRSYALIINTIKILTLPVLYGMLYCGISLRYSIWCYVFFELVCSLCRLPFVKRSGRFSIMNFIRNVFCRISIPFVVMVVAYSVLYRSQVPFIAFLGAGVLITIGYMLLIYKFGLDEQERCVCKKVKQGILSRIKL